MSRDSLTGFVFASAMILGGCAHHMVEAAAEGPFAPSQLNENAGAYHEHEVSVQGFVTLTSAHTIYESQELKEEFARRWESGESAFNPKDYKKYCLTIANPKILYDHQERFDGKTLVLRGKFIMNYLDGRRVDLGACPLPTALVIDEIELRRELKMKNY